MTSPVISVDFDAGPLEVPSAFIPLRSRTLSITSGRGHEFDRTSAGQLAATLPNADRDLDPDNTTSEYYPNVKPMRHARAQATLGATTYDLAQVLVDGWDQEWPEKVDAVVPLTGADAFKLFNLAKVAGSRYTKDLYSNVIDAVLTGATAETWYFDEASGSNLNGRKANFDLTVVADVAAGGAPRPPTFGRPHSLAMTSNDGAGDGATRSTGPAFAGTSPWTFAWGSWLLFDTQPTDGWIMGAQNTAANTRTTWRNVAGTGRFSVFGGIAANEWVTDLASVFLADGKWHQYSVRCVYTTSGASGTLQTSFYRDGVILSTVTDTHSATVAAATLATSLILIWVAGDGGLGGNHAMLGNMAQAFMCNNNAPSGAQIEEIGSPTWDLFPQEPAGLQIHSILDGIGWPLSLRAIDAGTVDMTAITFNPGDAVLPVMLDRAEVSERGLLFIDPSGVVTFYDAATLAARTSQATFGDAGLEIHYTDLKTVHNEERIYNQIALTWSGGTVYVEDATSITDFGPRLLALSVSLAVVGDVNTLAADLLAAYKDPHTRPVSLTLVATTDTDKLEQIFARQPGDRITVKRRPPGGGAVLTLDALIEGARKDAQPGGLWSATFDLAPFM